MPGLERILFDAYLAVGPAAWLLFGFFLTNGRSQMLLVKRPAGKLPAIIPRISVLIPAKDEGERMRDCLLSALSQDYPDFEVIAINDRSTDNTGAVMDEIAASNPKLKVVHIRDGELPEGWTGKCNALHRAYKNATGHWLLFMDSDVVIAPDALSVTAARAAWRNYDLLSLLPKLESHTFWEAALVPLGAGGVTMMYAVSLTNKDYLKNSAFANGQFLFIKRDAYEAMGGHESVRDKFTEDLEIARALKREGKKVRISWGTEIAAVRMYSSLQSIIRGWSRSYYAGSLGRPWRILLGILFVLICCYGGYVALAWGIYRALKPSASVPWWGWLSAAFAQLLLMHLLIGTLYHWTGNLRRYAFVLPISLAMLLRIFIKALELCATRKVEWRGTSYTHRMSTPAASSGTES
jgi:chlorobactene glucosyltransferase